MAGLLKFFGPLALLTYAELNASKALEAVGAPTAVSAALTGKVEGTVIPRAFGLVVLANVVGSGVTLTLLGTKVGEARKKYGVKLPHMYAPGDSDNERLFNCAQRGHQQALETYPQFLALSLVAGLAFPLTTAVEGALWCVARFAWAEGYATGDPDNRYKFSWLGKHVWTPLVHMLILSLFVGGKVLATGRL